VALGATPVVRGDVRPLFRDAAVKFAILAAALRVLTSVACPETRQQSNAAVSDARLEGQKNGAALTVAELRDENGHPPIRQVLDWQIDQVERSGRQALLAQLSERSAGEYWLEANDRRGVRQSEALGESEPGVAAVESALSRLQARLAEPITVFPHGELTRHLRRAASSEAVQIALLAYYPVLDAAPRGRDVSRLEPARSRHVNHLDRLEAESIHILREAVAEAARPVMLYSIGKDSSVMLHLARKAFYPASPPFPLLHVDTRWKFREMYLFRDHTVTALGFDLRVHVNPEAIARDINPFDHGSSVHTDVTKTQGLRQALDHGAYDVVFGGARRDEEKSRAKERVFSLRSAGHTWDPKNQRPEMWDLYNVSVKKGESLRVFPLSNWTEIDVWQYIYRENIPVVPLYFAKERPVVVRDNLITVIDDDRMRIGADDVIESRMVRFRTLGCYPLSGAIESRAASVADIILELLQEHHSERQGRSIDGDTPGSMERKKREGYF
jgi:sulfate adenylyltransferase subunit 2